jgi:hypothetical protein
MATKASPGFAMLNAIGHFGLRVIVDDTTSVNSSRVSGGGVFFVPLSAVVVPQSHYTVVFAP